MERERTELGFTARPFVLLGFRLGNRQPISYFLNAETNTFPLDHCASAIRTFVWPTDGKEPKTRALLDRLLMAESEYKNAAFHSFLSIRYMKLKNSPPVTKLFTCPSENSLRIAVKQIKNGNTDKKSRRFFLSKKF